MRQPIRAFILAILIGGAAFAFVARATEFIVVRDEITRIESFYRGVGILSPLRFNDFTTDHDVSRALDIVEGSRHVAISDTRRFTQGVFADRYNLAAHHQWNYFNPMMNDVDIPVLDHYFIGFISITPRLMSPHESPRLMVNMAVEELVSGDPTFLQEGDLSFTNQHGQTTTITSRHAMYLYITDEEARLFEQGLWCPFDGLAIGERALFRGTPIYAILTGADAWAGFIWYLRALTGYDGKVMEMEDHNPRYWGGYNPRINVNRTHTEGLTFVVRESDTAAMEATLAYLYDELAMYAENRSSVVVIETHDMSAMPRFNDLRVTSLLDTPIHPAGRFLTYEDYGRPVAVVPAPLAVRRGLHVGETFTITLRDNPRPPWIDRPTHSVWARGVENWWDNNPSGWWSMIDGSQTNWRDFPTYEIELEVVGVYWFTPTFFHNFTTAEIFIPAGVMPVGFGWDDGPHLTGMYSFVLNSPRGEESFTRETRQALYALGFAASFMPNDFENLAAATDPIRLSITVNLVVFGVASALILAFVVLLYLRQWRKSVAIAQALGIPRGRVLRQLFVPVVTIWVPSIVVGSVIAWFFAISQAEAALVSLAAYDAGVMPDIYLLLGLCGLIIVFILAGVWFGGYSVVSRPVLTQLQGGTQKRPKVEYVDPGAVPEGFAFTSFTLGPLPATYFSARLRAALGHSLRHIFRTPGKTMLALLLAIIFVFSLGWLDNTIVSTQAEIVRLWDTTIIEAEIFRDHSDENPSEFPAFISPRAWDSIQFSRFFRDGYLESLAWGETATFIGVSHLEGLIAENTRTLVDEQLGVRCTNIEIEFVPGFGPEDFVYVPGYPIPMIARQGMAEDNVYFHEAYGQVIGFFDGGMQRGINRFGEYTPIYIIPVNRHRTLFAGHWPFHDEWRSLETFYPTYMTARFTIDPARNRELDQLRELAGPVFMENSLGTLLGVIPLLLHIHDDVIYSVIVPMEQSLSLLRVLYPIAIGVAFLLALGLSLLTMLQSAKNAAIMRVLGKPRVASQVMLCAEQLMVCFAGVFLGLLVLFITVAISVAPLLLAGVYFGGAAVGSAIGAFVISMRAPLDLLQVKE